MTRRARPRPSRYDVLTELEKALTLAAFIETHLDDWTGPSSPGVEGVRRRLGHIADPTGQTAIASPSEAARMISASQGFLAAMVELEDRILDLRGPRTMLEPLTAGAATEKATASPGGVGTCAACGTWCSGSTDTDRLRSGMCDTDRKAWERAGRPDRAQWISERQREAS